MKHLVLWELHIALEAKQPAEIVYALNRIYRFTGLVPNPDTVSIRERYASVLHHPRLEPGCQRIMRCILQSSDIIESGE